MSDHHNDLKIATDFRQLRQVEIAKIPEFSSLLKTPGDTRLRHVLLSPSAGFAVVLLVLSVSAFVLLRPGTRGDTFDSINDPLLSESAIQLSKLGELPTDFLLNTPWPQLASLEPGSQLLDLPYEFLEELPDEP